MPYANNVAVLRETERISYNYVGVANVQTPVSLVLHSYAKILQPRCSIFYILFFLPAGYFNNSKAAWCQIGINTEEELASLLKPVRNSQIIEGGRQHSKVYSLWMMKKLGYYTDVGKFMDVIQIKYEGDDWRLFIDQLRNVEKRMKNIMH